MGKKSRAPPPSPPKAEAPPPKAKEAAPPTAPPAAAEADAPPLYKRLLPEGGLLPWWVVLVLSVYALLQIGLTLEHPCAVLGVSGGMKRATVLKSYRSLSMCTHPDKLVGQAPDDVRRGSMLFKRASGARDEVLTQLREDAQRLEKESDGSDAESITSSVSCSTQLDTVIYETLYYLLGSAVETGAYSMLETVLTFLWDLCTLQYDISMSISICLLLVTLVRTLQGFLGYLRSAGPISTVIAAFTTVVVGPLPTIYRALVLPVLRPFTFMRNELLPFLKGNDAEAEEAAAGADGGAQNDEHADDEPGHESDGQDPAPTNGNGSDANGGGTATATVAKSSRDDAMPRRGIRQRGRPQSKQQIEEQREALLRGEAPRGEVEAPPLSSLPLAEVVSRKPLPHARPQAAAAMQFDLVFSTTKYVIPLLALVASGQVFNGLWSSMITAQLLHKIPAMRPELHHLLIILAGALHTLLCAGKSQLTEMSATEGLLQLQWSWSVRDVLAVANVMALGATFAATAGGGNEPAFCASFAAGIAMRMLVYEVLPSSTSGALATLLRDKAQVELVGVDEVAVRAGRGVGTCSGGPVRFLLGSVDAPSFVAGPSTMLVKGLLLCLPALAAAQWALRCATLVQRLRREASRTGHRERRLRSGELLIPVLRRRLLVSSIVFVCTATLVAYFALFELNAVGSSLGNFLIVALTGCHFESLLSTYDVRGRLRSAVFFVMFMVL